jgi:hypothetical protein
MRRYAGILLLGAMVAAGIMALTMFGPGEAQEAEHLYHDHEKADAGVVSEAGVSPGVPQADAHWMYSKWCKHRDGWDLDHHMHFRSQFWKRSPLRHYHKEAYHHLGTPNDHDRRNTRCPLHN